MALLFVLGGFLSSATAETGIRWYKYSEGMETASAGDKKIFINFHADWCYYCKQMEKTTFKDSSVISYLNDNYIAIRVDTEKEKKLAAEYRIQGLPSSWFLEPDGKRIGMKAGYLKAKALLQNLKFVYEEKYKSKK